MQPLTLVSAPPGYGKSTMISSWLESVDCQYAWLSLDENDNELGGFLRYFLAAIQTIFPNAMSETRALLEATPLPPISAIANNLINELDQIKQRFILVLDDYHLIRAQNIHNLLNEMMLYPPRNLHLVLATRRDPLLPLITLRANGRMVEIRSHDLRFNQEETLILFQKMTGMLVDQDALIEIEAQAEGWVTGLRLAALAMYHRVGWNFLQKELSVQNRYVTEYLLTEILSKQAATWSDAMLKTSIVERFCADLCEDIYSKSAELLSNGSPQSDFNGGKFLEWLQVSNLFVTPLDNRQEWFRYHHLFRDFLQQELTRKVGPAGISQLHAAAGHWYARNGWIDEALNHLLTAGEISAAVKLVAQHRHRMMNNTQWPTLERWLQLFPSDVVENYAELWMLKTWLVYQHGQLVELPYLLQHLADLLSQGSSQETVNNLDGEISTLKSLIAYHAGDIREAVSRARQALNMLPAELWIVRVLARTYLGGSLLRNGDINGGYRAYYGAFEEEKEQNKLFKATILMTACNFHWLTADLQSMEVAANQCIALCRETDYRQILGYGYFQLGRVRYQQNDLPAAEELFTSVATRPYNNYGIPYTSSVCGLAMTYQALGREAEARKVTEEGVAFLLQTGNTTQLPLLLASQAELALRQGRLAAASQWAKKLNPVPPLMPMPWILAPHLTLVKVWLAQNTPTSQRKAAELLDELVEYLEGNHNTRFFIETLALQALLEESLSGQSAALAVLKKALRLAQPGGFIRLFVDLGARMEALLWHLQIDTDLGSYINQIQSAFSGLHKAGYSMGMGELLEPLTVRELQVLELLRDRLTNKEIATQLVISPGTVKGHTIRIYQKLDVKGRRQAVEKAISSGILSSE